MPNEYDNEEFFAQYAQMPRSRQGLEAAGEWRQLKALFPDVAGKRVLELGCQLLKQHHTLTQILMGLLRCGFTLEAVEKAQPPAEMMNLPGMEDELRRPMMLLVRTRK